MKFESLIITKYLLSVEEVSNETSLKDLPFLKNSGETAIPFADKVFNQTHDPLWNVGVDNAVEIYGQCNWVQEQNYYVDLDNYDELRLYLSGDGVAVRCWFINTNYFNTNNTHDDLNIHTVTSPTQNEDGKEYAVVDLNEVKREYGHAYLAGMKTLNNAPTRVNNITVYDANPVAEYVISGRGEVTDEVQAVLNNEDVQVIDATSVTKGGGTESVGPTLISANPNCLFIANDGMLANTNNVLVANEEGGYDCANLVLDVAQPIRIPGTIHATAASAEKNVTNAEYATMVLPFEVTVPENVTAYKLTSVEGDKIMGETLTTIPAGQPVLLEAAATDYTFEATEEATLTADQQPAGDGLLKGVYVDSYAPASSYVLQNQNGDVAFYKVQNADEQKVKQYTAYLTLPASIQQANRLIFALGEDNVTGVEGVEATAAAATVVEIYDLSGRQVSAPVKGINLMKMSDGTVKKVIVK